MTPWEHLFTHRPTQHAGPQAAPSPWERVIAALLAPVAPQPRPAAYLAPLAQLPESSLRPQSMLRSYQVYLAEEIEKRDAILAAAEMSLGKTGATLTGVRNVLRANPTWRAIIIAPLEVANNTWPDEVAEWAHLQDLTFTVVTGTPEQRTAALAVDADLTIINRENLAWLWAQVGEKAGWRWQVLVYDESSRLKGFTVRTKGSEHSGPKLSEFGVLTHARTKIKKVIELSGTPAPNGLWDLGGQARILFGSASPLGRTKSEYQNKFFNVNSYSFARTPKTGAEEIIMGHMRPVMIGLRSQDYIDLPPQKFNPIYVNLTPKLRKTYDEFKRTLFETEHSIEAVNKGVLTNKLLQLANGGLYKQDDTVDPPKREVILLHDLKIRKLESIIAEAAGKPVLIAYSFKFDKTQIKKRFPKAVFFDEEPDFVKKWNRGEIEIGVSHPASIGHGLNLQYGGHIQVWFGLTWSLELWDQFNRRLARPGQKEHTVFIHVILARGTEDERQYENLRTKGITQDQITESIRVRQIPKMVA